MGYKIWRKDDTGWWLAFDTVFDTREAVDEYIGSLNAQYAEKVRFGEFSFHPYRDDIKLNKDGSIHDPLLITNRPKPKHYTKKRSRTPQKRSR